MKVNAKTGLAALQMPADDVSHNIALNLPKLYFLSNI